MRVVFAAVLLGSSLALAGVPVSLADLTALAAQQAWVELLEKAQDVPPASRTEAWRGLVRDAAVATLRGQAVLPAFTGAERADGLVGRFPFLGPDPAFTAARGDVVASDIERCLALPPDAPCWTAEGRYESSLTGAGALRAARAFVKAGAVKYRPMALFAAAVTAKDAPPCRDADLADAVVAALDLPPTHDAAKHATRVAFELCWSALAPRLKEALRSPTDARLANQCQPMRARRALTELQEDLCHDAER